MVKVLSGVLSATYMVAIKASLADEHKTDAAMLTGRLGLLSATSGAAYAIGMLAGGLLVARQLRWPYAVSTVILGLLALLNTVAFCETLPKAERVPFRPRVPAFEARPALFRSGPTLRGLCTVNGLQQISVSMGDTWQVFARELRGWGSARCGLFGSLTGLGSFASSLMVRSSVRVLGTRGHSLLATGCVAVTELLLGFVGSGSRAFVALLPNWVGRTQQMAIAARITNVGARKGLGQGALAGDRQNMHSLIKVLCPTSSLLRCASGGSLFALGCKWGVHALPFVFTSV